MSLSYTPRQQQILDLLRNRGQLSRSAIVAAVGNGVSIRTVIRDIDALIAQGTVVRQGENRDIVYVLRHAVQTPIPSSAFTPAQLSTTSSPVASTPVPVVVSPSLLSRVVGDSAQTKPGDAPPLVDLRVNNPVNFLIHWWKRVISNEGMTVRLKPLTTIGVSIVVVGMLTGTFSLATVWWVLNKTPLRNTPLVQYLPTPIPTVNPWRQTAFTGTLRSSSGGSAFLITQEREGITLELPSNVDLQYYINRRILAIGLYNDSTHIMRIAAARDLEFLPAETEPVPTTVPIPSLSPSPVPTALPAGEPTAMPTAEPTQPPASTSAGL